MLPFDWLTFGEETNNQRDANSDDQNRPEIAKDIACNNTHLLQQKQSGQDDQYATPKEITSSVHNNILSYFFRMMPRTMSQMPIRKSKAIGTYALYGPKMVQALKIVAKMVNKMA